MFYQSKRVTLDAKEKGKFRPITGHEGPEGNRSKAVVFH